MDCVSNAHREDARSVVVLDVYAQLPDGDDPRSPWPLPPKRTASTYALEEGGKRRWGTEVTGFGGREGAVSHVYARQVTGTSSRDLTPVPGSEFVLEADLVLIAIGFEHPEHEGLVFKLNLGARPSRQHPNRADLPHLGWPRVCLRRCQDRAVAGGHRDRRGTQVRGGSSTRTWAAGPMDADRERLAVGAWSGESVSHPPPRGRGRRIGPSRRPVLHRPRHPPGAGNKNSLQRLPAVLRWQL